MIIIKNYHQHGQIKLKYWIYLLLIGAILVFFGIYFVFFHLDIFENNNPEMLYFKSTVIGVIISATFLFFNLFIILYLSISSDKIYEKMTSIVDRLERNLKGVEFSQSYSLITDSLDQEIEEAIVFSQIEDSSIKTFKDYERFLLKSGKESLVLHAKYAERYLNIYNIFLKNLKIIQMVWKLWRLQNITICQEYIKIC